MILADGRRVTAVQYSKCDVQHLPGRHLGYPELALLVLKHAVFALLGLSPSGHGQSTFTTLFLGKCVSHLASKFVFSRFTLIVYARHLGSTCIRYAYLEEVVHEVLSMPVWWMENRERGKMEGEGLPVNGSCSENIQEANQTKESAKRIILYHPT